MSTNVDMQTLRNFFISKVNDSKITKSEAKELGISSSKFETCDLDNNEYVDVVEALVNDDIMELFATMIKEEEEKSGNESDEEQEKEEQNKVQDKSGAGGA